MMMSNVGTFSLPLRMSLGTALLLLISVGAAPAQTRATKDGQTIAAIPPGESRSQPLDGQGSQYSVAGARGVDAGTAPGLQQRNPRYRLQLGDVVDLTFPLLPEFNQSLAIQPDGYITLLSAGDLHVAGETLPEMVESIKTAYGHILANPVIAVNLKDFDKPHIIVTGEVARPGKYELRAEPPFPKRWASPAG